MAVGATGLFEIAAKAGANQAASQQAQLQLPPVSTGTSQSSTASTQASSASTQASTASSQSPSQSSSQSSSGTVPAGYVLVAQLSSLSGRTSAYFTHPSYGNSILLSLNGQWRAFSATCTHRPCTVEFASSELYCPCHGATFSATNGSVTRGPAQVSLGEYGVLVQGGGLYVSDSVIN
jgi:Rieske Fe-S protein